MPKVKWNVATPLLLIKMNKRILPIFILTASVLLLPCCFSCSQKNNPEPEPKKEEVDPDDGKPKAGNYTFTVSPLKGKWEAGDQIHVHGSYGPKAKTFTLQASQISSDGKTATIAFDSEMLQFLTAPDFLYAAYPASAVKPNDGLLDASTTFSQADILLSQAYLDGKNFTFDDASSRLTFSLTGDYDKVVIGGTSRVGMRFSEYTNEHSTRQTSFSKVASDGYPFREVEYRPGETLTLWFPGGVSFEGGFTIYLGKGDEWPACYVYSEDLKLKAGKTLDLGDISSKVEAYTGPAPKMPEMGKRTKYTVKLNELSGICLSADKSFLWGLGDGSELGRISLDGEVLEKVSLRTTSGSSIDSEDISLDYNTGDLYIGGEPASVCHIPHDKVSEIFTTTKFKGVVDLFTIDGAKNYGNAGLEGLTYYKDGLVYAGTQTNSNLYLCKAETGEVIWTKGLREKFPVITEIAGLCYDPVTDWLWVIDSESRRFFALTADAEQLLGYYSCRGIDNPESICVDQEHSCIWVGDDYGSTSYLYRYDFIGLK